MVPTTTHTPDSSGLERPQAARASANEAKESIPSRDRSGRRLLGSLGKAALLCVLGGLTYLNIDFSTELVDAERAYESNDLVRSTQFALDRLEHWPPSQKAEKLAALSLTKLGYSDLAEPHFLRAGELTDAELKTRAFGLVRSNLIDEAIKVYVALLKRSPADVSALRQLAALYLRQSRWEDTTNVANTLIGVKGGEVVGYTLLGQVHSFINPQSPLSTIEPFEKVLQLDPQLHGCPLPHPLFWKTLAEALLHKGDLDKARQSLIQALSELDSQGRPVHDASLVELLGEAYLRDGEAADAERCFRTSIEWDPNRSTPYLALARIEFKKNNYQEALEFARRAAEISPNRGDAFYVMSRIYRRLGEVEKAKAIEQRLNTLRESANKLGSKEATDEPPEVVPLPSSSGKD